MSDFNDARDNYKTEVKKIWESLANEMGWSYKQGPWYNSDIISINHNEHTITLDNYRDSFTGMGGIYSKHTRVSVPLINEMKFKFSIYKEGFISTIGKFIGFQDIKIGNRYIDSNFIFKSNDNEIIKAIFKEPKIYSIFEMYENFNLELRHAIKPKEYKTSNAPGVHSNDYYKREVADQFHYELYFMEANFIEDVKYLKHIVQLYQDILDKLSELVKITPFE